MKTENIIYFKNAKGQLEKEELSEDWMKQNRGKIGVFAIGLEKASGATNILVPVPILDSIPWKKQRSFAVFLEKLADKYKVAASNSAPGKGKGKGDFALMSLGLTGLQGKVVKKAVLSILDELESLMK
jgi:hypothetical protein